MSSHFEMFVAELIPAEQKCSVPESYRSLQNLLDGYAFEKTRENKMYARPAILYLHGEEIQRRPLGNFNYFTHVNSPGTYELVVPSVVFRAKVFKLHGPPQDEANSYWAKIICERLTYSLRVVE